MIKIDNITFSYTGTAPYILNNVTLSIPAGEYISIMGDNGSGKSTLMKLLLGFLKPISGSILCNADKIGYVPQKNDFSNSGFPITVYEALDSYRRLLKIKDKAVVNNSLHLVGMENFSHVLVGTLSGGQHQKILIARALIGNPTLLVLDEPSSGIDVDSQIEIYKFIKKLNQEQHMTILSVEHNLEAATTNSTQIYHLAGGHGHLCNPNQYTREYLKNR